MRLITLILYFCFISCNSSSSRSGSDSNDDSFSNSVTSVAKEYWEGQDSPEFKLFKSLDMSDALAGQECNTEDDCEYYLRIDKSYSNGFVYLKEWISLGILPIYNLEINTVSEVRGYNQSTGNVEYTNDSKTNILFEESKITICRNFTSNDEIDVSPEDWECDEYTPKIP